MKKISLVILCNLFVLCFSLSCKQDNHHNVSIHISDSEQYYKIYAYYNEDKTRGVEKYMNDKIGTRNNMSFINTKINGQLALDDHTTFYIKKYPGYLQIKFEKEKNSGASYKEIKDLDEGLKRVMQ